MVDEGNLVRGIDPNAGIVTITEVKPITVVFTLPQQQLAQVNAAQARGAVTVEALDADGKSVLDRGVLQVVDNQVDQTTGTVRMKAEFPNANLQLWPGQFVNVRVLIETLEAGRDHSHARRAARPQRHLRLRRAVRPARQPAARSRSACRTRPRPSSPRGSPLPTAS